MAASLDKKRYQPNSPWLTVFTVENTSTSLRRKRVVREPAPGARSPVKLAKKV
jgi:hypothetical protein